MRSRWKVNDTLTHSFKSWLWRYQSARVAPPSTNSLVLAEPGTSLTGFGLLGLSMVLKICPFRKTSILIHEVNKNFSLNCQFSVFRIPIVQAFCE
jgi:hypothetical protein